jgi:hypothetical protein
MSTAATPHPAPTPPQPLGPKKVTVISHSSLFYWWPVWAAAFIMGLISLFSGEVIAVVPAGTQALRKDTVVRIVKDENTTEELKRGVLVIPEGSEKRFPYQHEHKLTKLHISNSKNVGVLFVTVLMLVIFITNVPLRGLWSVIVIGTIIFLSIIFAILGWWDRIFAALDYLDIRINAGGYFVIGIVLCVLWAIVTFLFDKQIYMEFVPGRLDVRQEIGGGVQQFDTAGMSFEKQRSDLFRHMILGFGSGDLIVRTAGANPHVFEIHNVLSLGRRVREIEQLIAQKAVTAT